MAGEEHGQDGERLERGDRVAAQAAPEAGAAPEEPEAEGHLLSNPYLLEQRGDGYREQMRADISYERSAAPVASDRGPVKQLLAKVRRRDNG